MTAALAEFHDMSLASRAGLIVLGILAWIAGMFLLSWVYKTFR